jgi:hypothetical protein
MAHLAPGYCDYVLTDGHCSCDLYRSPSYAGSRETVEDLERKLCRKYRKKGWGEAKIRRAVKDATAARERRSGGDFIGLHPDVRVVLARVADEVDHIYAFVHQYSGGIASEQVKVKLGPTVSSDNFGSGEYVLEEDTLVTVKGQK